MFWLAWNVVTGKVRGKSRGVLTILLVIEITAMVAVSLRIDNNYRIERTGLEWDNHAPTPTEAPLPKYSPMVGPTNTPDIANTPTPFVLPARYIPATPIPQYIVIYTAQPTITSQPTK